MTNITLTASRVLQAAACVSTENYRDYLKMIRIEPLPNGGAILIATNGHILIMVRDSDAIGIDKPYDLLIDFKLINKKSRLIEINDNTVTIDNVRVENQANDSMVFPEWRRVLPKFDLRTTHGTLGAYDTKYLALIGKIVGNPGYIKIISESAADPALVLTNDKDVNFVLMPLRAQEWGNAMESLFNEI
jgi:hypothetical protein